MIGRRAFITGVAGGLVTVPLLGRAQGAELPVIGYLNGFSQAEWTAPLDGFRKGLREAGYAEGKEVLIEYEPGRLSVATSPSFAGSPPMRPSSNS